MGDATTAAAGYREARARGIALREAADAADHEARIYLEQMLDAADAIPDGVALWIVTQPAGVSTFRGTQPEARAHGVDVAVACQGVVTVRSKEPYRAIAFDSTSEDYDVVTMP